MPNQFPYCSLTDVQRETKQSRSEYTEWFNECIQRASRWIDAHCLRDFKYHDHRAEWYEVSNKGVMFDTIYLPWPVLELDELRISGKVLAATDYLIDGRVIYTRNTIRLERVTRAVAVKGTFGYVYPLKEGVLDTTQPPVDIPEKVRRACTMIASAFTVELRREVIGQDGNQGQSVLDTRVPNEAKTMLASYKRRFL